MDNVSLRWLEAESEVAGEDNTTTVDSGFVSDDILNTFMAVFIWSMPALCLLAVIFCAFNAAVYWQQRAASFALYLVAVDLGDGLCSLLELLHTFTTFSLPSNSYIHLVVKWYLAKYVAASFRRAAVCLNALASLERFLAIAFPLKSVTRHVCSRPAPIITSVFVTSLAAHVYFALELRVAGDGRGGWRLQHSQWRRDSPRAFGLWAAVDSLLFAYSPLAAIMLLNITLLIVLKTHALSLQRVQRSRGQQQEVSGCRSQREEGSCQVTGSAHSQGPKVARDNSRAATCSKREKQTTKMVLVFSTVFLFLALPRMLNSSVRYLLPGYGPEGREGNLYHSLSLLAQVTSHLTETALFWVNFTYSRHFRRSVFRLPVTRWLCHRWLPKTSLPATSSSDVSSIMKGTYSSVNESVCD